MKDVLCEPTVSVIVPIYNVDRFLEATIHSILCQTYKNIEIILVDDGSKDCSGEICDLFLQNDNRIIVVHKKNGGLSDARNTGLAVAQGKYIFFVDADDTIQPDLVEVAVAEMELGFDMVAFGYHLLHQNGKKGKAVFENKEYRLVSSEEKQNFILGPFFRH